MLKWLKTQKLNQFYLRVDKVDAMKSEKALFTHTVSNQYTHFYAQWVICSKWYHYSNCILILLFRLSLTYSSPLSSLFYSASKSIIMETSPGIRHRQTLSLASIICMKFMSAIIKYYQSRTVIHRDPIAIFDAVLTKVLPSHITGYSYRQERWKRMTHNGVIPICAVNALLHDLNVVCLNTFTVNVTCFLFDL